MASVPTLHSKATATSGLLTTVAAAPQRTDALSVDAFTSRLPETHARDGSHERSRWTRSLAGGSRRPTLPRIAHEHTTADLQGDPRLHLGIGTRGRTSQRVCKFGFHEPRTASARESAQEAIRSGRPGLCCGDALREQRVALRSSRSVEALRQGGCAPQQVDQVSGA